MQAPFVRTTSAIILLAIAGAATLAAASGSAAVPQPDPAFLAAANGAVLGAEATAQPSAAAIQAPIARASATPGNTVRDTTVSASRIRMSIDGVIVVAAPTPAVAAPVKATPAKAAPVAKATPKAAPKATAKAAPKAPAKVAPAVVHYTGTNHVWIPALGINKAVQPFACSRVRPPDSFMYRWGCAGENNVYLLGHAYASMKPLHNAYNQGTLKVGMKAIYADGAGQIHTYAVIWWKVTLPTTDAAWAWAPQSVPSMTLQTCVGANSKYRLMVRLEEVIK